MLIVNLRDGRTVSFDLCSEEGFADWESFQRETNGQITGLAINHRKTRHTFPRPLRTNAKNFGAEVLKVKDKVTAERIWAHLGPVRVMLTVYLGKRAPVTRVDVRKLGVQKFRPGR